jgi:hypothetical protein
MQTQETYIYMNWQKSRSHLNIGIFLIFHQDWNTKYVLTVWNTNSVHQNACRYFHNRDNWVNKNKQTYKKTNKEYQMHLFWIHMKLTVSVSPQIKYVQKVQGISHWPCKNPNKTTAIVKHEKHVLPATTSIVFCLYHKQAFVWGKPK